MAGRTLTVDEHTFGIVVFHADSQERAGAIVEGDPAVKYGVMRAELFAYRVSLWSHAGPAEDDDAM
jgi:regulator of protease activity HflC (stomatin/prohibitin superfamily)